MMIEFDLETILGESVDSLSAKLSEMSDQQLVQLRVMEAAAVKPRSTLIAAIDTEQSVRSAKAGPEIEAKAGVDGTNAPDAGDPVAEFDANLMLVSATIAELEAKVLSLQADNLALTALLAEAGTAKPKAAKVAHAGKALVLSSAGEAGLDQIGRGEVVRVVFADEEDVSLPSIPALLFEPYQMKRDGLDGFILDASIAFPAAMPRGVIARIWALPGAGKAGLVATLVSPLEVGGGRSVEIPGGHLRFTA